MRPEGSGVQSTVPEGLRWVFRFTVRGTLKGFEKRNMLVNFMS